MTKKWYDEYYSTGEYRTKNILKNKRNILKDDKLSSIFGKRFKEGRFLAEKLGRYFKPGLIIDVGSGTGGLLSGVRSVLGNDILGVEPSLYESNHALKNNVQTKQASIEDINTDTFPVKADNVFCTQALNHFLDPRHFFSWAYGVLKDNGVLYLEVKNFILQSRKSGKILNSIQIDHPYMFAPNVLKNFAASAGFDLIFFEDDARKSLKELALQKGFPRNNHIRLVAVKSSRKPFSSLFLGENNYSDVSKLLKPWKLHCWNMFYKFLNRYENMLP
ncbi:MAG: methyltransferase domain-containing protein [Minisyncoccia bacterium]